MQRTLSWQEASIAVLKAGGKALRDAEIADRIIAGRLKTTPGAAPAATVGAQLCALARKPRAPVEQVGRGLFRLRPVKPSGGAAPGHAAGQPPAAEAPDPAEGGLLRAFGMFRQREHVVRRGSGRLPGRPGAKSRSVDLADQIGICLLHDRDRLVCAGRAADSLSARLRVHTGNRLFGRWDRFSWFGLRAVDPETGRLQDAADACSRRLIMATLEALLIESLEPPRNRRRGDGLDTPDYHHVPDPGIEARRRRGRPERLAKKAGL